MNTNRRGDKFYKLISDVGTTVRGCDCAFWIVIVAESDRKRVGNDATNEPKMNRAQFLRKSILM